MSNSPWSNFPELAVEPDPIIPRRKRQKQLLQQAQRDGSIKINIEGGMDYNKDLRDLVQRGLLDFRRISLLASKQRVSVLVLTSEGEKLL